MTDKRKQDRFARWGKTREKGMARYVIENGVLSWGLVMCFVFTVLQSRGIVHYRGDRTDVTAVFLSNLKLWLIAGAFYGIATWYALESAYKKHLQSPFTDKKS